LRDSFRFAGGSEQLPYACSSATNAPPARVAARRRLARLSHPPYWRTLPPKNWRRL